jgi:C1A family cysteine protease
MATILRDEKTSDHWIAIKGIDDQSSPINQKRPDEDDGSPLVRNADGDGYGWSSVLRPTSMPWHKRPSVSD